MALRNPFAVAARVGAALILLSTGALLWNARGAHAAPEVEMHGPAPGAAARNVRVIDGDTVENIVTAARFRLKNVQVARADASCPAEREMGERTAAAAMALVGRARRLEVHPAGSVDAGGANLAYIVLDGRDLGELLMAQGLARRERAPLEPWCDSQGNLNL